MVLKDILAISGEPGLFKFIAQGKNAIIVEHLESGKRSSAFSSAKSKFTGRYFCFYGK